MNIGNNKGITIAELAEKIIEMTKSSSEVIYIPYNEAYEKGFEDMRIRVPELSKAKKLIGIDLRQRRIGRIALKFIMVHAYRGKLGCSIFDETFRTAVNALPFPPARKRHTSTG